MATVSTGVNQQATIWPGQRRAHLAPAGAALVFYWTGSAWEWRTSSGSPYTSWSSASTVTGAVQVAGLASVMDPATGNLHVIHKTSGGPDVVYRLFTYSAGSWSMGSSTTISTFDSGGNGEPLGLTLDASGRIWACIQHWTGSATCDIFYSATGTSWTSSLTGSVASSSFSFGVCAVGNYVVFVRCHPSSGFYWRRVDITGSLTSWSTEQSFSTPVYQDHNFALAEDGAGRLLAACSPFLNPDHAIYTATYSTGTDSWTARGEIGTGGNDRWPSLAKNPSTGNVYCVWSEYAASNSYAVVYKEWDDGAATWGSKTTLQASGANRLYTGCGCDGTTLLAVDTEGTSSYTAEAFAATVGSPPAQDTPELRGRPHGLRGHQQMRQLLAQ